MTRPVHEPRRGYDDACGAAHGLELIGERWALLVLRELMLGPRRFSDLRADLPGISANVLSQRLAELEQRGLVQRRRLPPPAAAQVYEATPWGLEAEPVLQQLGRWAARSPRHDPGRPLSAVSLMLSLRTMIDPARAAGLSGRFGFCLGDHDFVATLADGRLEVERGEVDAADVRFTATPSALAATIYGDAPLETVAVAGNLQLARRFVTLFPLPAKVG